MPENTIFFTVFLIFVGAAVFATLALYARQSLLVAYILLGVLLGPWGAGLVTDAEMIGRISEFGIVFLLFLLGLNLQPQELLRMVRKTTQVTVLSSVIFVGIGWGVMLAFGYPALEALLIGAAMIFSSTIIGLKLLPTTVLHHQHTGEVMISILLLQDLIAIVLLLVLQGTGGEEFSIMSLVLLGLSLPGLMLVGWLFERYVLIQLIRRFDKIKEYIFLLAIAWCLGMAELSVYFGLSVEIGAFIAGITLAASPIAFYIAESLKPLRDFFLVIFFFSMGAGFNPTYFMDVLYPAMVLAIAMLVMKPMVFRVLLVKTGESEKRSKEVGYRLGQLSEFSLLIAVLAMEHGVIREQASYVIQLATLLTFLVSSYLIVLRFPTPIAVSDRLRRD